MVVKRKLIQTFQSHIEGVQGPLGPLTERPRTIYSLLCHRLHACLEAQRQLISGNSFLVSFCFYFGPHLRVHKTDSWLCTQASFLAVLGDPTGCWESNPGQRHTRQAPHPTVVPRTLFNPASCLDAASARILQPDLGTSCPFTCN